MIHEFIQANQTDYPVRVQCKVLRAIPIGYYQLLHEKYTTEPTLGGERLTRRRRKGRWSNPGRSGPTQNPEAPRN